jgi:hypothetical protein
MHMQKKKNSTISWNVIDAIAMLFRKKIHEWIVTHLEKKFMSEFVCTYAYIKKWHHSFLT